MNKCSKCTCYTDCPVKSGMNGTAIIVENVEGLCEECINCIDNELSHVTSNYDKYATDRQTKYPDLIKMEKIDKWIEEKESVCPEQ